RKCTCDDGEDIQFIVEFNKCLSQNIFFDYEYFMNEYFHLKYMSKLDALKYFMVNSIWQMQSYNPYFDFNKYYDTYIYPVCNVFPRNKQNIFLYYLHAQRPLLVFYANCQG